uniref:probable mitochondrial chaperone BCS1-B n=1 Tax=Fragaria vesca subsp. vesca TaxID=101020 RepID=UPI0005C8C401|nr:PREDICTED: probable mitochondrial chaperone BCS1-B [Fragaria vesca subsp. vesca]XP_011470101.1 PREDICTED: probable mitochondrial chaperone BCS1-B [Fragaria vesca subsp. vesca]XP_011470102.1 PREDICTED: probable mitochondrial chaperone BCS1-B [Fragaria vesca subsp. vesca]
MSALLSTAASFAATLMLGRSMVEQVFGNYSFLKKLLAFFRSELTFVVVEYTEVGERNKIYDSVEPYLRAKLGTKTKRVRVSKTNRQKTTSFTLDNYQEVTDTFENFSIKWRYICIEPKDHHFEEKRYYELRFHKKHRDRMSSYLDYVVAQAKEIKDAEKVLRIYSRRTAGTYKYWESTILEHPCTFETLAMDPSEKKKILEDLDMFVQRKEFYKHVGKAWKRGYLLYGPPGTGKSSLIAAMANYLNYNIYDLELTSISNNADLRQSLLSTTNRSILIIEDIDCTLDIQNREKEEEDSDDEVIVLTKGKNQLKQQSVTLSGLLNFIDGLWSSCGDERIIVFTTNYKDKLDPALLRPGRMDMHIHMSYCTVSGFKILAYRYLGIHDHPLYKKIEGMIQATEVTPAQVAGQLQVSNDADVALAELVKFIKEKEEEDEKKKKAKKKKEAEAKKLKRKRLLNLFQRIKEIT